MNCPKHPSRKMVQLLTSWVCDECSPAAAPAPPAAPKGWDKIEGGAERCPEAAACAAALATIKLPLTEMTLRQTVVEIAPTCPHCAADLLPDGAIETTEYMAAYYRALTLREINSEFGRIRSFAEGTLPYTYTAEDHDDYDHGDDFTGPVAYYCATCGEDLLDKPREPFNPLVGDPVPSDLGNIGEIICRHCHGFNAGRYRASDDTVYCVHCGESVPAHQDAGEES